MIPLAEGSLRELWKRECCVLKVFMNMRSEISWFCGGGRLFMKISFLLFSLVNMQKYRIMKSLIKNINLTFQVFL